MSTRNLHLMPWPARRWRLSPFWTVVIFAGGINCALGLAVWSVCHG